MLHPIVKCFAVVPIAFVAISDVRAENASTSPNAEVSAGKAPSTADARAGMESGLASVYAEDLEGRPTASGAPYDSQKLTAAHRTLPLGSRIKVVDVASGKSVSVTVNDRWSGGAGQIVNLSRRAADELGMRGAGQRKVEITVETLGDGKRDTRATGATPVLLPERIESVASDRGGRTRVCANEADILGLRDALWESHVRSCLGRKSKAEDKAVEAKTR